MTITYEPAYDRKFEDHQVSFADEISSIIKRKDAKVAFRNYLNEEPLLAYKIAKKHNLVDEKIEFAILNGEFFHAAIIAQENGLVKEALKNFERCGDCQEYIEEMRELLSPKPFPRLDPKYQLKKQKEPNPLDELTQGIKENFYNKN